MLQQIVLYGLTFISGLFFGSFYNLVSDRIPKGRGILTGRSKCDHCGKTLGAKSLLPLLSFAMQKGKCVYCGKRLSTYYPVSEVLTGLVFMGVAFLSGILSEINFATVLTFIYFAVIAGFYIILTLTDLKYRLIPNKIIYTAIIFVTFFLLLNAVLTILFTYNQLKNDEFGIYLLQAGYLEQQISAITKSFGLLLLSSLGISAFFLLLIFITKGKGMGGGDVKLAFLIGMVNGFPFNIAAIFLGFVFGAVFSIILVLFRKKSLKDTVPFGPFLILGSVIAFVWGEMIWYWYVTLLS